MARHEPEQRRVGETQLPEPEPPETLPVTLATCPNRSNRNFTLPREPIWPEASKGVSPAALTRPPVTRIIQL